MTDLENHWDDLPVGPAPVDAILREARRQAAADARRRPEARLRRSLLAVAAVGAVAAAFVAGSLVSTPDAPPPTPAAGPVPDAGGITPIAFQGELQAPASCEDLLQQYVDRGVDQVSDYGWTSSDRFLLEAALRTESPPILANDSMPAAPGFARELRSPSMYTSKAYSGLTKGAYASDTGTNVQEAGVDEPDTVKTDGEVLVRLRGAELTTYDVSGPVAAGVTELGSLDLGDFHDGEVLLAGDTVVAIGNDGSRPSASPYGYDVAPQPSPQTRVLTVDVSDPTAPTLERTVDYDAALVAARQHGDAVRVVLSKGLPDLEFVRPGGRGAEQAVQDNRALVEETTLDDWLPHVSVDGGEPRDLLDCDRVAVPRAELGLATMAVVGFDAATPGRTSAFGLAGDAPMTYESPDHLYLAAGAGSDVCFECFRRTTLAPGGDDGTTHVYDFALDGNEATYVGAGEVEGYVRDRWSMDESGGVLRLAVGPSSETGNYNSIVTLRVQGAGEGAELVEVGRLDGLGVGEDIKSVRWFDDSALLVTYRQVDPLYAVDLRTPARPRLLGELKIPGFSSYLHPLGPMRVVGMGSDGGARAQAGLFDVTDLSRPDRLDLVTYGGGSRALAGDDPRQFTWLPGQRVALTVVQRGRAAYVSRLQVGGGQLANEMTRVEFGSDAAEVRTLPLPGGKVALVTGEDVQYFDVS